MKALTEHPHYEILERCGQGGMGVVYRARDRHLNRIVALKFLIAEEPEEGGTGGIQRFRREAEAIAALNHPAIATIFESGDWDGSPFLALEFLSGGTLRDKIRASPIQPTRKSSVMPQQLSSGLAFAHSKGILHRDIKPGNCMFSEHGALKFVDFGLAKPIDSEAITQPGSAVGTIAYMAPEVLRGQPASVRSDLYSLGAVVFEMAAGRPLYRGGALGNLVREVLAGPPRRSPNAVRIFPRRSRRRSTGQPPRNTRIASRACRSSWMPSAEPASPQSGGGRFHAYRNG